MGLRPPAIDILDACSLLNLVASRRFAEIARDRPMGFVISAQVASEVEYVRRGGRDLDANDRDQIDLQTLEESGSLRIVQLAPGEEISTFVAFAREMDDGEAASCALAVHRGGRLISDDRKARRMLAQRSPTTPLLATSEVIKAWAEQVRLPAADLVQVLRDVEERAGFRPGRHDPLADWWGSTRRNP